jgi:hypothetical protein
MLSAQEDMQRDRLLSPIRPFHIADDCLSPIVDMDVLNLNELVPSMPQSAHSSPNTFVRVFWSRPW